MRLLLLSQPARLVKWKIRNFTNSSWIIFWAEKHLTKAQTDNTIENTNSRTFVRDAGLILAPQKAEHYEIATYGTLRVFAANMKYTEVERLLSQTLEEEKIAAVSLKVDSNILMSGCINYSP